MVTCRMNWNCSGDEEGGGGKRLGVDGRKGDTECEFNVLGISNNIQ